MVMTYPTPLAAILIRHGQTQANVDGLIQGQTDSPLTYDGIASSLKKSHKIRRFSFDAVFCSDLPRAIHTFKVIQEAVPSVPHASFRKALREIDFGAFSGRPKKEVLEFILKHKSNPGLCYPGGESGAQFIARIKGFFSELLETHAAKTVLIVTHYGVIETAVEEFAGGLPYRPRLTGDDDVWQMLFENDSSATLKVF